MGGKLSGPRERASHDQLASYSDQGLGSNFPVMPRIEARVQDRAKNHIHFNKA